MGFTLPVGSPGIARLQAQPPRCRPVLLGPSGWDGLWPPLVLCPRAPVLGTSPAISLRGILIFIVDISHAHSPWSQCGWARATVSRQWTTCAAAVT